jgi:hypothetical protein
MSTRSLRARLDRLTRSTNRTIGQEKDHASDFTIDPALAKAIRDDCERLNVLFHKRWAPSGYRGPPSASGKEEEQMLHARIAERASAISCPPGYGQRECFNDYDRLDKFFCKRLSPPLCGGGPFSDAEDAEEAQLRARVEAFRESPEGHARQRIGELSCKKSSGLSTAEQSELDSLQTIYPYVPRYLNDPLESNYEAWTAAAKKAEDEMRERMRDAALQREQRRLAEDQIPRRPAGD